MKPNIFLVTAVFFLAGCVSQSEYDKLQSEKNTISSERDRLKRELEELRFGAPNLLADAKTFFEGQDYKAAKEKLDLLLEKHPGRPEVIEGKKLLAIAEEELLWQEAMGSEDIGYTERYIAQYNNGRHISTAQVRLAELKQKHMQSAYDYAVAQNNAAGWQKFIADYPDHPEVSSIKDKIIRLEVDEIFSDSQTGKMPSFDREGYSGSGSSTVSIDNDTGCELVVRYSGPNAEIITIPVGGSRRVSLSSGYYKITASACGYNYAGTESLSGDYNSTFYITTSRY